MKLPTEYYLPESSSEIVDPTLGLADLRKGLNTILLGYLLSIGAILMMGGVVWYLVAQSKGEPMSRKTAEQDSTVLFAACLLLALAGIGSLTLIVRGKWICLSSAPEQHHAKWMMFLSILCVVTGPALNLGAFLVGDTKAEPPAPGRNSAATFLPHAIEKYGHGMLKRDTRGYVKLAGQSVGLFSSVFLVLFLRAVALCWGARQRVIFTELYLLFLALLVAGVVVLFWKPSFLLARPQLLLGLGGGWLLAGVWNLALILSTSIGISSILARQSPRGASLDVSERLRYRSDLDFLG